MKKSATPSQRESLPYTLAEALTAREPALADVTVLRLKAHESFVRTWLEDHPDLLNSALAEGFRLGPAPGIFSIEVVLEQLLPHLIPLVGVMRNERPLYTI